MSRPSESRPDGATTRGWVLAADEASQGLGIDPGQSTGVWGDLALRPHVADDYDALRALWATEEGGASLGLSGADEREAVVRFLERNPGLSLGMWRGDRLVGSVLVGEDGRRGYVYHAVVHPTERRRGLGRLLVEGALRGLRDRGVQKVHAMVYEANREGRAFWQEIGFVLRDELVVLSRETFAQQRREEGDR